MESSDEEGFRRKVSFPVGGKPDFVVDLLLLEDKGRAALDREQPSSEPERTPDAGFEPHHLFGLFVHPRDPHQRLQHFLQAVADQGVRLRLKVENDHVLAAKAFASRVDETSDAKKARNPDVSAFLVLVRLVALPEGVLARLFGRVFPLAFLKFPGALIDARFFLLLLVLVSEVSLDTSSISLACPFPSLFLRSLPRR